MTHNHRFFAIIFGLTAGACSDGGSGGGGYASESDALGVGAECRANDDCVEVASDGGITQSCLAQFKGGYCGIADCVSNEDCPTDSACVIHVDLRNYCFRSCVDKADCNANRSVDNASNCSANVEYTDGKLSLKSCVPPSG